MMEIFETRTLPELKEIKEKLDYLFSERSKVVLKMDWEQVEKTFYEEAKVELIEMKRKLMVNKVPTVANIKAVIQIDAILGALK